MRPFYKLAFLALFIILTPACNTGPKEIEYGHDACQYCKMTIVDKIHAAELVTDKGKVFKFDATECLLHYLKESENSKGASLFTNYFESPTKLISSEKASYLISENLPSPMAANLTAFKSQAQAEIILKEKGGKLLTWDALITEFHQD
jgi:copper chaperone NosL